MCRLWDEMGPREEWLPEGLLCGRRLKSDVRSFVRPMSGDFVIFAIFAFTVLTWPYMGHRYCLLKKIQVLILEPSSLNFLQAKLYRLFFNFFQKRQKSPGVVSGGKTQKSDWVDPFPLCKMSKNTYFFADENSWPTSDWRHRTSLFRLFHTRAPTGHPCPAGVI